MATDGKSELHTNKTKAEMNKVKPHMNKMKPGPNKVKERLNIIHPASGRQAASSSVGGLGKIGNKRSMLALG